MGWGGGVVGPAGTPVQWVRSEAGALNTGQRSVRGPACPAAIFSLAVSNETAQGPRKKGLLRGHPAPAQNYTRGSATKEAFRRRSDTPALDTRFFFFLKSVSLVLRSEWKFPLASPGRRGYWWTRVLSKDARVNDTHIHNSGLQPGCCFFCSPKLSRSEVSDTYFPVSPDELTS